MPDCCHVQIPPAAVGQIRKPDPSTLVRVAAAIDLLAGTPRPPAGKKLVGRSDEWRVRTGDHRIVYEIYDQVLSALTVRVAHRREVYSR